MAVWDRETNIPTLLKGYGFKMRKFTVVYCTTLYSTQSYLVPSTVDTSSICANRTGLYDRELLKPKQPKRVAPHSRVIILLSRSGGWEPIYILRAIKS